MGAHDDGEGVRGVVMNRPSRRVEQDALRERMRAAGMNHDEIAIEFARRYKLRPRVAHRYAHGWTQQQAADRINAHAARAGIDPDGAATMTPPWLSELETWPLPPRRRPTPQMLTLLAEVYGCDLHSLLDLDDREHLPPADKLLINSMRRTDQPGPVRAPGPAAADVHTVLGRPAAQPHARSLSVVRPGTEELGHRPGLPHGASPDAGGGIIDDVDRFGRRTFSILAGSAAVAGAVGAGRAGAVDPALADHFSGQLVGHLHADMRLGSRTVLGAVTSQCEIIVHLVDTADSPARQRLAKVGSSFCAFAAWLWLDAGDPVAALRYHDQALDLAHRSGERDAVACALVDRAMAFTDAGRARTVVDLCQAALLDARYLTAEVQVFALQQQAHGASLLGDRRQVDMLLDRAVRLLDRVDVEVWGTACRRTHDYVEVQRATCYGRLGLAYEADRLWQQIIPGAPATARRDVGVWAARHATAVARLGEPDRAAELAHHAADITVETGSARARRELAAVATAMTPWRADPVGAELTAVLAPIINEEVGRNHG